MEYFSEYSVDAWDGSEEVAAIVTSTPSANHEQPKNIVRSASASSATVSLAPPASSSSASTDQLERCGRWLSSIPRDDVTALRDTPEYKGFLQAFERLGQAHKRVVSNHRANGNSSPLITSSSPDGAGGICEDPTHGVSLGSSPSDTNSVTSSYYSAGNSSHAGDLVLMDSNVPCTVAADIHYTFPTSSSQTSAPPSNVFLQHTDDVILRILEFLECHSLIRASLTCSRFHQLAHRGATHRTNRIAHSRQLHNVMQLLRAREQIFDGDFWQQGATTAGHVRVPMLLLGRRILVTHAGDPEFNGIYYCTSANGNGYVFTKPRYPIQRMYNQLPPPWQQHPGISSFTQGQQCQRQRQRVQQQRLPEGEQRDEQLRIMGRRRWEMNRQQHTNLIPAEVQNVQEVEETQQAHLLRLEEAQRQEEDRLQEEQQRQEELRRQQQEQQQQQALPQNDDFSATRYDGETVQPGQPLRCSISKRFSDDTILWYMSKEEQTVTNDGRVIVRERFSFWARLMVLGTASPDACRYPSQTSILSQRGEGHGWQSLHATVEAPTVELLD